MIYSNEDPTYRTGIQVKETFSFAQAFSISLYPITPPDIETIHQRTKSHGGGRPMGSSSNIAPCRQ